MPVNKKLESFEDSLPKISVIIPTYERVEFLRAAINSVLVQTFQDFEIIVIDDGSEDISAWPTYDDPRVHVYTIPHSGLPSVCRNTGIRAAKGEWIAFLDDDDEWLPDKLRRQLTIFEDFPSVGHVSSNAFKQASDVDRHPMRYFSTVPFNKGNAFNTLLKENFVINSSAIFKKGLVEKIGYLREDRFLRACEDYDYWLRMAAAGVEFFYISEPLVIYRDYASSIRDKGAGPGYWSARLNIITNVCVHSPDITEKHAREVSQALLRQRIYLLRSYVKQSDLKGAGRVLLDILTSKNLPFAFRSIVKTLIKRTRR